MQLGSKASYGSRWWQVQLCDPRKICVISECVRGVYKLYESAVQIHTYCTLVALCPAAV